MTPTPLSVEWGTNESILTVVLSLAIYACFSWTGALIFKKAGVKPWQSWVPYLNSWRLLQLGGQKGWWVLIAFIPIVGSIFFIVYYWFAQFHIGRALGKSDYFVLLAIFLSPIWFGILAFGGSTWAPKHVSLVPESAKI